MNAWKGKSKGNLLGYKIFVATLRIFGLSVAYFILGFVIFWYFLTSWKSNRIMFDYFVKIHNFSKIKSILYIYKNYFVFGQVLIDKIALLSGIKNKLTFNFDGENYLHKMVNNGKGGMLIGAHLGNWEIAGYLLKRIKTKINIVMFDEEHQNIKKFLESNYQKSVVNVIAIKNDLSHIIKINEAISNNEFICMHGDRFIEGNKTIELNFMGKKALFPAGVFLIAVKYKIPVSFVFAIKESNKHYHFMATEAKTYEFSGKLSERSLALDNIINDYKNNLEDKLKKYPEHWFNYFEFWKN